MSQFDDEDDKPTVVLDFNALKKKAMDLESLSDMAPEIEFNVRAQDIQPKAAAPRRPNQTNVVLFDFQSEYFKSTLPSFPKGFHYEVVTDLDRLNTLLQMKKPLGVVFNYNVEPRIVNQLVSQIKKKFPHVSVMIMAKALSDKKAKLHAATPAGAHEYVKLPFEKNQLLEKFKRMVGSKAA